MKHTRKSTLATVACWLAASSTALAQTAPTASTPEPVIELSPFEVNSESDSGYSASGTMAGTRLRTELRDVPAAISVVTKEFMQDIGVNGLDELLNYTTSTEVAGLAGNFSNAGGGADFTDFFGAIRGAQGSNRVRGVASADQTRDYFITGVPLDSYIVDRVEVNRGPNSMLFGLGSAGGVINSTIIKAALNNSKTRLEAQYGQHGTGRVTLDHNQVLIKDKLAVRVAGLYGDKRYQIDPAYIRDERYFITATFRPWNGATLRASVEDAKQKSNKPYNAPPTDNFTWWWDLGKPVYNPITGVGSYLGTMPSNPALRAWNPAGGPTNNLTSGGYARMVLVQEDPNSSRFGITGLPPEVMAIEGFNDRARFNLAGTAYNNDGMRRLNWAKNYLQALNRTTNPAFNNFWRDPKLTDPSIFNFYEHGLEGDAKYEWAFSDSFNAVFEQRLGSKAGIEIAYAQEKQNTGFVQPYQFRNHGINIDIATHLPNGAVNPNLGRPMMTTGDGFVQNAYTDRKAHRATAYYDLDLSRVRNNWLGKLLGRHIFTGNYTSQEVTQNSNGGRLYALGVDYLEADAVNQPNRGVPLLMNSTRWIPVMSYLGPSLLDADGPRNNGIQGLTVGYPRAEELTSVTGLFYPTPPATPRALADWQQGTFSVVPTGRYDLRSTAMNPTLRGDEVDSLVFVANSYFWDKTLVSTLGWRKDSFRTYDAGLVPRDPVTGLALNDRSVWNWTAPDLDSSETSFNYGLVLHLPPSLRGKLPLGADVSLTYNESDNFRPSAPRANYRGENIAAPSGTTEEWGALISLFDNKLELRATKYETRANGATDGSFRELQNQVVRRISSQISNLSDVSYLEVAPANAVAAWNTWLQTPYAQQLLETFEFSFITDPTTGRVTVNNNERIDIVVNTTDVVATGYEFDVIYNPTRQWRISFNAAKQETVRDNTGRDFLELISNLDPVWGGSAGDLPDGTNSSNTLSDAWATTKANAERRINSDGEPAPELRKWRFNFVTNYSFTQGRLKGFRIGGAYRWQDKAAIGFPVAVAPDGSAFYDVTRPFYGPTEGNVDGWIGYSRNIFGDRVRWSAQLNVRNIGKGDRLIPVSTQPDGTYDSLRIGEAQTWLLTNSFEF
jgi:outer membrane receptor protein involved in Fe transport